MSVSAYRIPSSCCWCSFVFMVHGRHDWNMGPYSTEAGERHVAIQQPSSAMGKATRTSRTKYTLGPGVRQPVQRPSTRGSAMPSGCWESRPWENNRSSARQESARLTQHLEIPSRLQPALHETARLIVRASSQADNESPPQTQTTNMERHAIKPCAAGDPSRGMNVTPVPP